MNLVKRAQTIALSLTLFLFFDIFHFGKNSQYLYPLKISSFMINLNLPAYSFKIKDSEMGQLIFDASRKKFVKLTPEEWVRQHLVEYLKSDLGYPAGLLATEMGFKHLKMDYRADVVIYNNQGNPLVLAEVKAPDVNITAKTFEQIFRYNHYLKAKYLIISNGLQHYCCSVDFIKKESSFLNGIPHYNELK